MLISHNTAKIGEHNIVERCDYATAAQLADLFTPDQLECWRDAGEIFVVDSRGFELYPRYAFEFGDLEIAPYHELKEIIAAPALTPWELAWWFCCGCQFLAWRRPQDVLANDPGAVLKAALYERASREQ